MKNLPMKQRIFYISLYIGLLISFLFVLYMAFLLIYPFNIMEVKQQPLPVISKQIKQGDNLVYVLDYCKYMSLPSEISPQLVDGIIFAFPTDISYVDKGCNVVFGSVPIPVSVPKGKYYMRFIVTYKVQGVREINYMYKTEEFEVI